MIVFSGEISGACKKKVARQSVFRMFLAALTPALLIIAGSIALAIIWEPIVALMVIPGILLITLVCIPPRKKKDFDRIMPNMVKIDGDEIECRSDAFEEFRMLYDVTEVLDFGEWYQILFTFSSKSYLFICQKSLITEGALEDFEKLFEDKITRKRK